MLVDVAEFAGRIEAIRAQDDERFEWMKVGTLERKYSNN